ncbi:MAG TPA: KpsF/GutQ family sugar-phosphate isomerase [Candidatus Mcinerneyibacteriales bacterium]|jgi:arabinose-5-phosphate isomerase|nr:KpsF/GutQ family sugar-phosphate isomerase [Candidatus Mcinerneyibacteriales bacterium]HPE21054.1 KpsF/GutQ family sugar-phosphate isomerase [Candidatus Mcinerneyibacteriales bacterium]HPJ69966.1 KpsF/GutQ family sugar-phosphate isomerase [Candidatus Mcinerneyibacteriales bacterium]HPQ89806.1 KpsF/GutQ family sugar-phosphate isomerase [Candidatus Mcinerneyibacteriales bacterium]
MKEAARRVLDVELEALKRLYDRIDNRFFHAVTLLASVKGSVVITGMGKSGLVGRKISATLASTGTPSFFLHPAEASHGDLGMIRREDLVIAISNSGETEELIKILPTLKRMGVPLIAITGKKNSTLARYSDEVLDISVEKEACPLNLAPTASTTVTLVLGDMLAITLLEEKGFKAEDFALYHPGGALGKKLLLTVADLMVTGEGIPRVSPETPLKEAIYEISSKGKGMTTVADDSGRLLGIFTDGDFKRFLQTHDSLNQILMKDIMIRHPKTITEDKLAAFALKNMEDYNITSLVVVDDSEHIEGVIHIHDILKAGIL